MSSSLRPDRELFAGRYRVFEELGDGVFKARDVRLGRAVTLKFLPAGARSILVDLKVAARVAHPNVAAVLDAGEDGATRFVAREYVDGTDLARILRDRGPMSVAEALDVLIGAARGLEASQARGVVHGDLKPSGMLLGPGGAVRVTGLGLGRLAVPEGPRPEADIGRLGGILHFLLTGREPFDGESPGDRLSPRPDRFIPEIRIHRPDVPARLAEVYRRLMAPRPEDRPGSMAEVVRLLESCRGAVAGDREPAAIGPEFDLSGLGIEPGSRPTRRTHLDRPSRLSVSGPEPAGSGDRPRSGPAIAAGLVALAIVWAIVHRLATRAPDAPEQPAPIAGSAPEPPVPPARVARTIFGGRQDAGNWMLSSRRPLPGRNIQPDGLNPHESGSYLVVYRHRLGDFILDFDYKISPGGNSGVFLRVGGLDDPMHTGIEVSITDRDGIGLDAPGAFHGLVAPSANARKPAGEWNHMTITAGGPTIAVTLNGRDVSRIQLDEWTSPGHRPDGTPHEWPDVAFARLPRTGYLGFQDLVGDCWFREVVVRTPEPFR